MGKRNTPTRQDWICHDSNNVVVAICANEEDAKILHTRSGYGYSNGEPGSYRLGEDYYKTLSLQDRRECNLPLPKNIHAWA